MSQGQRVDLWSGKTVRIVAAPRFRPTVTNSDFNGPRNAQRGSAREVESLLWLAAGAAWAVVALKAWSHARRIEARRRTFQISDKLLGQVFPTGPNSIHH